MAVYACCVSNERLVEKPCQVKDYLLLTLFKKPIESDLFDPVTNCVT